MRHLAIILFSLLLCAPVQAQVEVDNDQTLALGWKLLFSDDFGRTEIGPDWQMVSGEWTIKDGMLCGQSPVIVCTWQFTGSIRLEFDAIASDSGFSDLSAIVNTRPDSGNTADGYFFGFGVEGNTTSKLLVRNEQVNDMACASSRADGIAWSASAKAPG